MPALAYQVIRVEGLAPSSQRGVVFLKCDAQHEMKAAIFERLPADRRREVLTRFDHWISGQVHDKYFHGFQEPYRMCFTFKWKQRNLHNRFYGFLWNPQPSTRPWFRVCALAYHDVKTTWDTDLTVLADSKRLWNDQSVRATLQMHFPDKAETTH